MNSAISSRKSRSRRPQARTPGRLAALRARLHRQSLDLELARGIAPWRSPAHAARALQLTTPRRREICAQALERVLADTEHRPRGIGSRVAVPPDPAVILNAPLVWQIVATLRDPAPVSAEGMARLQMLLCDGGGPLYRADGDQLRQALDHIARWLPVAS